MIIFSQNSKVRARSQDLSSLINKISTVGTGNYKQFSCRFYQSPQAVAELYLPRVQEDVLRQVQGGGGGKHEFVNNCTQIRPFFLIHPMQLKVHMHFFVMLNSPNIYPDKLKSHIPGTGYSVRRFHRVLDIRSGG